MGEKEASANPPTVTIEDLQKQIMEQNKRIELQDAKMQAMETEKINKDLELTKANEDLNKARLLNGQLIGNIDLSKGKQTGQDGIPNLNLDKDLADTFDCLNKQNYRR